MKVQVLPYVIFGLVAAAYAYKTVKDALNDPPEETREYDCYAAEVLDSEDSWFDNDPEVDNG